MRSKRHLGEMLKGTYYNSSRRSRRRRSRRRVRPAPRRHPKSSNRQQEELPKRRSRSRHSKGARSSHLQAALDPLAIRKPRRAATCPR
jgi:hypothetical protein